jgi:YfiH family protein
VTGASAFEEVAELAAIGITAYTTTRELGSLGIATDEPVRDVMGRWNHVRTVLAEHGVYRLATASQVHEARVITHEGTWQGWLRASNADGHASAAAPRTALAVTIADCVPIFLAHPSGAVALLHSGWRGTAARIVEQGIGALSALGCPADELVLHLGPAICGRCYEVGADVASRLLGRPVTAPTAVDLRAVIADHASALGVRSISVSRWCTRCDNVRFFSHRAGDAGRQIAVIASGREGMQGLAGGVQST